MQSSASVTSPDNKIPYPIASARLNHIKLRTILIHTTDDCRDTERPHRRVEGISLGISAHTIRQSLYADGKLILAPPALRLVAGAGNEVSAVGDETGVDLLQSACLFAIKTVVSSLILVQ